LAIVRKIVEEHGGRVDVASDSKGTVFTLSLPQAPPEPGVTVRAREGSS
jgi:signal transduction histidine kinase